MALHPVAGARIYIGQQLDDQSTDFVEADFSTQSWLEIDGFSSMGNLGDTAALISTDLINRGRTVKQKGTFNAGQMQNQFAILPDDLGQIALRAASAVRQNYAFRLVFDDAPAGGTASERLFIAMVMSAEETGGGANTVRQLNGSLEINSNIVRIDAAGP